MSLRVWLPLTKDLRNQGLSNITATNSGATYSSTGGKLGGCYSFDGTDDAIGVGNLSTIVDTDFSWSCWFYRSEWSSKSWETIFGGPSGFELETKSGSTNSPLMYAYSWGRGTFTYELNQWNHLVMTRTTSETKFYLNGELKLTGTAGTIPSGNYFIGSWSSTTGQNFKGKVNDIRIYDHCLSPMEVKELAKGLVLHYPLNRNGWGQENLHKNSDTITSTWSINQGTVSDGVVTITPTTSSDRRIYQMPANGGWTWQSGKTYTASIDAKSPNGAILIFFPYGAGSMSQSYTVTSDWKRYTFTFTATQSGTASMTYHVNQTSGVSLQLKHPKLEEGSVATPWCPNSSDTLATTMGLNSTTEYDCSGFCNNASSNGSVSLTHSSDTPKYNVSTVFASGARIATPISASTFLPTDAITVSIWFKSTNAANRFLSCTEGGGFNFESASGKISFPIYITGKGYTRVDGNTTWSEVSDNKWHMITATYDKQNTILYVDGQLDKSTVSSYPNIDIGYSTVTPFTLGAEAQTITSPIAGTYVGNLSDCRIYATALSADDVKSLYQNSAYIDSSGNVYGAAHSEV